MEKTLIAVKLLDLYKDIKGKLTLDEMDTFLDLIGELNQLDM